MRHRAVAATPMAFVRAIALAYTRAGRDPGAALAQAGIDALHLHDDLRCVTAAQFEALSGHAMQELDDEALGWFSRRLPWGSYGLLCRASVTAPTLGVALQRWCRHHRLLTEDVLLRLDAAAGSAALSITEERPLGAAREFCLVSLMRYVHGFACWATDSRISLQRVCLPFEPPAHAEVYPLLFPGPIAFDHPSPACMTLDARYLALPLVRDEAAMRAMLQRALPLTVRQYRRDRLLVARVRELLRRAGPEAATAPALAERLNVSVRTLHRQLREEGARWQDLKDEARHARAIALLRDSRRPLKQVALAAGFRNEKSFTRAFRGWTGMPPGRFRSGAGGPTAEPEGAAVPPAPWSEKPGKARAA